MQLASNLIFWGGKRLPYQCELEYIESTGTQWINTGVSSDKNNCRFTLDYAFTSTTARQLHGGGNYFYFGVNAGRWEIDYNKYEAGADTARHTFVKQATRGTATTYIDGALKNTRSASFTDGIIAIDGLYSSGTVALPASGKLYHAMIEIGGVLVADLIPVLDWDGNARMFDQVTQSYPTHYGTFVAGPEIYPVEYLQGDGNAYIDTPIVFNSATDTVEADFALLNGTIYKWCFGSHDTSARCAVGSGDGMDRRNVAYGNGTTQVTDSYFMSVRCSFKADATGAYLNNTKIRNARNFAATTPMRLFGLHLPNDSGTYASQTRLWSFAVTRSDTSIATYTPIRVGSGSTWEGAMLDTVERKVYRNAGTGAFLYGNDI